MALKQTLSFKLQQKLSPQQIQLMKLIQLPTQAFEQRLKQELEEKLNAEIPENSELLSIINLKDEILDLNYYL